MAAFRHTKTERKVWQILRLNYFDSYKRIIVFRVLTPRSRLLATFRKTPQTQSSWNLLKHVSVIDRNIIFEPIMKHESNTPDLQSLGGVGRLSTAQWRRGVSATGTHIYRNNPLVFRPLHWRCRQQDLTTRPYPLRNDTASHPGEKKGGSDGFTTTRK